MSTSAAAGTPLFSTPDTIDVSGPQDILSLSSAEAPNIATGTISFAVEFNDLNGTQGLYSRDASGFSGDGNHLSIYSHGDKLFARVQSEGTQEILTYDGLNIGELTHVAFSFDGAAAGLYVDGALIGSVATGYTQATSPEATQFGGLGWSSTSGGSKATKPLDGTLSDIAIYDAPLDAAAIDALAQGKAPAVVEIGPEPIAEPVVAPVVEPISAPADPDSAALYGLEAMQVDGRGDVEVLEGDELLQISEGTIRLTFTANDLNGTQGLLSRDASGYSGDGNHLSIYLRGDELFVRLQDGEETLKLQHDGLAANTSYQIGLTFDGANAVLSVDGEVVDEGATGMTWETSPEPIQIGALGWASQTGSAAFGARFDGEIADLEIYDVAFDADTLNSLTGAAPVAPEPDLAPELDVAPTPTEPEVPETPAAPVTPTAPAEEVTGGPVVSEPAVSLPDPGTGKDEPAPTTDPDPQETLPNPNFLEEKPLYAFDTLNMSNNGQAIAISGDDMLQLEQATIAFAFNADRVSGQQGLFSRDAMNFSGDGNHISIYIRNGTLHARLQDGENSMMLSQGGVQAGQEYHVAVTFDGSQATLHVNGAVVDSGATTMTWETSPEAVQIGALGWTSNSGEADYVNPFDGEITDFAIYDLVLDNEDIGILADGGLPDDSGAPVPPGPGAPGPAPTPDPLPGPAPDPTPDPAPGPTPNPEPIPTEPEPDPTPGTPPTTGGDGTIEHGIVLDIVATGSVSAGRVTTLDHGDPDVSSIRIVDGPQFGNLTVNPDNTLALVMSGTQQTGNVSFSYEVTYDNGTTETFGKSLNVTTATQDEGWALGEHYMLEEGADGNVVVEHGAEHREVYVSNSNNALSAADIAQIEGINVNQIDGDWLANNPQYGASEEMALRPDIGMELWDEITRGQDTSNWLLLESGYEYDMDRLIIRGSNGESELNPLYIGSYGEGARPVVQSELNLFDNHGDYSNIVLQGLEFANGITVLTGENILIDDALFSDSGNVQNVESMTIRNSEFIDIHADNPRSGSNWSPHADRTQGLFAKDVNGLLLEDLFLDMIGWEEGYDYYGDGSQGQPPSIYSHNIYLANTNTDVTLRDTISMRSAGYGAQIRSGGLFEDNIFLDNNAGFSSVGGDYKGSGTIGNYTVLNGNVVTSAGYRDAEGPPGALSLGIHNLGAETTMVNNIVAHLADPENYQEYLEKYWTHDAVDHERDPYFDDTIIYNWVGSRIEEANISANYQDDNIDGLDTNLLDQTTIQNFAADLTGDPNATIGDLADYLRDQADGTLDDLVDADVIAAYFAGSFGTGTAERTEATEVYFTPDDRADGVRWDNRLNWDTEDLPGTVSGDAVNLGGNWVNFGGTAELTNLSFGAGGELSVDQGKLTVTNELISADGAGLQIDAAGQIWVEDYHSATSLDIDVDGGRFANTGTFDGAFDMDVTDGSVLLAADTATFEIGNGSRLTIDGGDASVGFDGQYNGVALVQMEEGGVLEMISDRHGFSTIEEHDSGAFDTAAPAVLSAFDMGGGTLVLDVSEFHMGGSHTLIDADEIFGAFDDIQVDGMLGIQDATLVFDYDTDQVTLELTELGQGTGQVNVVTVGDMMNAQNNTAIWDALTDGQSTFEVQEEDPSNNGKDDDEDNDPLAA